MRIGQFGHLTLTSTNVARLDPVEEEMVGEEAWATNVPFMEYDYKDVADGYVGPSKIFKCEKYSL